VRSGLVEQLTQWLQSFMDRSASSFLIVGIDRYQTNELPGELTTCFGIFGQLWCRKLILFLHRYITSLTGGQRQNRYLSHSTVGLLSASPS
jgi:hypothetical protein